MCQRWRMVSAFYRTVTSAKFFDGFGEIFDRPECSASHDVDPYGAREAREGEFVAGI
jgi:hypothetical protein